MPANQISSRARTYALYTGVPHQAACAAVAATPPGAPLIPAPAQFDQLLLESEAFYRILNSQRYFFECPFGIRYVQLTSHGIELNLESDASLASLLSGLLRRIGVLHTVAVPHVVTGHEARLGEWWILQLEHDSETALRRAELVQALLTFPFSCRGD